MLKGAAFTVAGLSALAAPEASLNLLRFTLATLLIVSGGIAYWGRLWHRTTDMSIARAVLSMAVGVGLLFFPISTIRAIELDRSKGISSRQGLSSPAVMSGPARSALEVDVVEPPVVGSKLHAAVAAAA